MFIRLILWLATGIISKSFSLKMLVFMKGYFVVFRAISASILLMVKIQFLKERKFKSCGTTYGFVKVLTNIYLQNK